MSQENVQTVRRFFEAWNRGDVAAFMRLTHPDGEFLLPRNILDGGSYRGLEGLRRAYADLTESWDEVDIQITEIRDAGDYVVVLGRNVNVGKHGGPRIEQESAFLVCVRDGKIAYERPYQSHAEAIEAAGLSEQAISQENVEIVKAANAALNSGDLESAWASFAPDAEMQDLLSGPDQPTVVKRQSGHSRGMGSLDGSFR